MVERTNSLVLTSDRLSQKIAEQAEKIFPAKNATWRSLSRAIGIFESSYGQQMILVLVPSVSKKRKLSLRLFIDEIKGNKVKAHLFFPLYGEIRQQDEILRIMLSKMKIKDGEFVIESAGIVIEMFLPFTPIEVRYGEMNGHNGCGQKAFICPDEVVLVS